MSAGIAQACAAGAGLGRACAVAGLSPRTLQRWCREGALKTDGRRREHRPEGTQRTPANRLSSEERDQILEVANTAQFAHLGDFREPSYQVGGTNQDVPLGQRRMTFQASLERLHRLFGEGDTFLVDAPAELHNRMDALPAHAFGPG